MPATGYQFQGRCYTSQADAISAHWSQQPVSTTPGTPSLMTDIVWDGAAWVVRTYSLDAGALQLVSSVAAPTPGFPSCDPAEPFKDGMEIGAGVAAAIIMAYIIRIQGWGTR